MTHIAVLTGDIVRSTRLAPAELETAIAALADAAAEIGRWSGESTRFTRARGDGWQLFLARPGLVLRAVLYLRASLRSHGRGFGTRISVAVAEGRLPKTGDLNGAGGDAFVLSGRGLDRLAKGHEISFNAHDDCDAAGASRGMLALADALSRGWSVAQGRVLQQRLMLESSTQAEIAARLHTSQQAVAKVAGSSAEGAILQAINVWEELWTVSG